MAELSAGVRNFLRSPTYWMLGTINADGHPQVNPMWLDLEGDDIILNTAIGRLKEKNVRRDPRATLAMTEPENPYAYVEIRGTVVEFIEGDEAEAGIDSLAKKYIGKDVYPWRSEGERRVKLRVEPTYVTHFTG